MIIKQVALDAVAVKNNQYPDSGLPEVAFVGKSNVGKSSLINAMLNRKAIARVSQAPGKTRTINFYSVNNELYFVDLPGYGYAKASHGDIKAWGKMIETYLTQRETLRLIVMLTDIRHAPSENDKQMLEWLQYYGYPCILVATKLDKIKKSQTKKQVNLIKQQYQLDDSATILPFSSKTKEGKDRLWDVVESFCLNTK